MTAPVARRVAILAEGGLDPNNAKTAAGVVLYSPHKVVAVIDSTNAGRDLSQLLPIPKGVPVVASLEEALRLQPQALLLGTAPRGGALPEAWRATIKRAIEAGLDIHNGLHKFLSDDPEFARPARKRGVQLIDYRKPPAERLVARALCREMDETIILTVGSDCSVGKMTTALEMARSIREKGLRAAFVATGQTGMMIAGGGCAIDAIPGDFMAGAVEKCVLEWRGQADIILVEGQGSLLHPGYSGVMLALLHGATPDGLVFCHDALMTELKRDYEIQIPRLQQMAAQYEEMARFIHPTKTIGVALRTQGLDERAAREAIQRAEAEFGLPATDCLRFGAESLADAAIALWREKSNPEVA